MLSTIRLIFGTRWARFVLAVVALFCAVGVTASALATSAIKTKIGTIERLRTTTSDSGDYKYDTIQLAGDGASYTINRSQFTPTLNADQLASGEPVTIWYNQSPLNDPSIVAIQMPGASGGQLTRYVTDFYTHPDQSRTSNLILAAVFAIVALAAILAGIFLPAASKPRKPTVSANPWYP